MRAVLTDEYIKDNYKLYRTIPHGVALPHRELDPKKLKRFIVQKRKAGMILPQQQVQSISLEAINALSTGGQAEKIRQTASKLYLDIQGQLFEKQKPIEEIEKRLPVKLEEVEDKLKIRDKMIDDHILYMGLLYDPINLRQMTYREKVELLKDNNVYDEIKDSIKERTKELRTIAKESEGLLSEMTELKKQFEEVEEELGRVSGY